MCTPPNCHVQFVHVCLSDSDKIHRKCWLNTARHCFRSSSAFLWHLWHLWRSTFPHSDRQLSGRKWKWKKNPKLAERSHCQLSQVRGQKVNWLPYLSQAGSHECVHHRGWLFPLDRTPWSRREGKERRGDGRRVALSAGPYILGMNAELKKVPGGIVECRQFSLVEIVEYFSLVARLRPAGGAVASWSTGVVMKTKVTTSIDQTSQNRHAWRICSNVDCSATIRRTTAHTRTHTHTPVIASRCQNVLLTDITKRSTASSSSLVAFQASTTNELFQLQNVTSSPSLTVRLKTHLFSRSFPNPLHWPSSDWLRHRRHYLQSFYSLTCIHSSSSGRL